MRQHAAHANGALGCCEAGRSTAGGDGAAARSRILIADDGDDVRRLLRLYLRTTGAEIIEVTDGRSACDAAFAAQNAGRDFDLILLDMEMPRLDGYTAATMMRL